MKRTKQLLLSILSLLITSFLFAQDIPERVMDIPFRFDRPTEVDVSLEAGGETKGKAWVVFSDRSDNPTFTSPGGAEKMKTINFMERFYVIGEDGMYLRLAKDDGVDFSGKLSSNVEDYGWVSKEKLLLWQRCHVTDRMIDKKAMLLNTVATLKSTGGDVNERSSKIVKFHLTPELNKESDEQSQLYQVFYIYKLTKKAVLLGRVNKIHDDNAADDIIMGWVPISRLNFWDHRIAIEPNWNDPAVQERKDKGIKAMLFGTETIAKDYKAGNSPADAYWNADPFSKRNLGDWRRFPILKKKGDLMRAGIMGEISSIKGTKMTSEANAKIQRTYNEKRSQKRNINIVFVIDGTNSMQPFFAPVSSAVDKTMEDLTANYNSYNVMRFAAVVYRGFAEGNRKIEVRKITPDYHDITNFLNGVEAKDYNDRDKPEAVFYGVKSALRQVGIKDDETNIVVLIGDTGNHGRQDDTQVSREALIDLLKQRGCHFLAFQVAHDTDPSYQQFIDQTKDLIQSTAMNMYREDRTAARGKVQMTIPKMVQAEDNVFMLQDGAFIGRVVYCNQGEKLDESRLESEISDIVKLANEYTDKFLNTLDKVVMDGRDVNTATEIANSSFDATADASTESLVNTGKYVSSYTPAVMNYLRKLNIPDDKFNLLCEQKYQFYMAGWTSPKIDGLEHPVFKSVLFLTRLELGELLNDFEELVLVTTASDRRQAMKDAWVGLLQKHIGNVSVAEIEEKSMEEITEMVFGLPSTSELLADVKLKHITDPAAFDDRSFQRLTTSIDKKYRRLEIIFNQDNYDYSFKSTDVIYYWVEDDLLP